MSLTKDDLKAFKSIIDVAIEDSKQHTAAGFAGVDGKFANIDNQFTEIRAELQEVKNTIYRVERLQHAKIKRLDQQEITIKRMRTALHAA